MAGITFRNIKGTALTFSELDANLGEYFVSASISGSTLEFFKSGSGGTVISSSIAIPSSTSTIDTGSFAVTGSNVFVGNQVITGSVDVTGSVTFANDISINDITVGLGSSTGANVAPYTNLAVGDEVLRFNTTGNRVTGIGYFSLRNNTSGNWNTALGANSLTSNTTGDYNVALGADTLYSSNSDRNIAIGWESLYSTTSGTDNIGIGYRSLKFNSVGSTNIGIGTEALYNNTSGSSNTALGDEALYANVTGSNNTSIGKLSLSFLATGSNNTALGYQAGYRTFGGLGANANSSLSVFLGANTTVQSSGQTNQIVIGYGASGNGSNTVTIGNSSITSAHIQVDWTITSDERDKVEISPIPHGLDFVHQLNPIQYQFKDGDRESTVGDGNVRYGFSAQEILALEGENPVIVNNKDPEKLKLTQAYIIPTLVKAIKELSEKVTILESRLNSGG